MGEGEELGDALSRTQSHYQHLIVPPTELLTRLLSLISILEIYKFQYYVTDVSSFSVESATVVSKYSEPYFCVSFPCSRPCP
jgi:hypothetical protein